MTSLKTEDDIARGKDAVEKMKGAKGAMEAALRRIETLEGALRKTGCILEDVKKATSPHVSMWTYYHGNGTGSPELATIHQIIKGAQTIITKTL